MAEFAHHPEDRRHFVRRLEAFSDIVYGFSLSQTGFALVVPPHANELFAHPGPLIAGALSFLVICLSWLTYHRMYATAFVAEAPDVIANFAVLATVASLPFALRFYVQFGAQPIGGVPYILGAATNSALIGFLLLRGYLRFGGTWTRALRLLMWRRIVRNTWFTLVFLASIPLILRVGPQGTFVLLLLWLQPVFRLFIRTAPVWPTMRRDGGTLEAPAGS